MNFLIIDEGLVPTTKLADFYLADDLIDTLLENKIKFQEIKDLLGCGVVITRLGVLNEEGKYEDIHSPVMISDKQEIANLGFFSKVV